MPRLLATIMLVLMLPIGATAQKTKKKAAAKPKAQTESREVKKLRGEKNALEQDIKAKKNKLNSTKKDAAAKQKQVNYLQQQLNERVQHIHKLELRIDSIDRASTKLEKEINAATRKLKEKKHKYAESLRYARTQHFNDDMGILWFALQADTWQQMYRRARYAREYASHQLTLGKQIMSQQAALQKKKSQLLAYKNEMNQLLAEISEQRSRLMAEHRTQQQVLGGLKAKQKDLTTEIEKQQKRLAELDNKIDQLIAREIEAARKRAEEAERKRREAEEAARRKSAAAGKSTSGTSTSTPKSSKAKEAFVTTVDRQLSGTFENNKGRLPVPITGSYRIGDRMGVKEVMKGVQLDNKGINYVGQRGACARAIFDGEVTAVFSYGGMTNVLIRHGSYISVYCNLSSVRVHQGQKVKARDLLGAIDVDEKGETTLLFQLRKERVKLNPAHWIAR